jgi:hypothetical protein
MGQDVHLRSQRIRDTAWPWPQDPMQCQGRGLSSSQRIRDTVWSSSKSPTDQQGLIPKRSSKRIRDTCLPGSTECRWLPPSRSGQIRSTVWPRLQECQARSAAAAVRQWHEGRSPRACKTEYPTEDCAGGCEREEAVLDAILEPFQESRWKMRGHWAVSG